MNLFGAFTGPRFQSIKPKRQVTFQWVVALVKEHDDAPHVWPLRNPSQLWHELIS